METTHQVSRLGEAITQANHTSYEEDRRLQVTQDEAYALGKVDFNFFSALMLPDVCTAPWPDLYLIMWQLIISRNEEDAGEILRFALGLPRGFAKTTFVKLLLCWLIAYDRVKYILIVAANEDLATNILSDIDIMLSEPQVEQVYGQWHGNKIVDNNKEKICMYHGRRVILYAIGSMSGVRGINKDNHRPDFILCDDMQTKENDESETERTKLLKWFTMTLLKCIANQGDRIMAYLGNMYSEECILYKLAHMPEWKSIVTGAILADGNSLWPEVHSLEAIIKSFHHDEQLGLAGDWFAEIMNDPQAGRDKLMKGELHDINIEGLEPSASFLTIDPAGYRKASDDNVITNYQIFGGDLAICEMQGGNWNPKQLIETAILMAIRHRCNLIGVESVAYQQTLCYWLEFWLKEMGLDKLITVVELKPHGRAKESRIREFIGECTGVRYEDGRWIADEPTIFFADLDAKTQVAWWANKYKIGVKDNRDDWLDAPAYGLDVRREYGPMLGLMRNSLLDKFKRSRINRHRINTRY